jgi:hypothetical protein
MRTKYYDVFNCYRWQKAFLIFIFLFLSTVFNSFAQKIFIPPTQTTDEEYNYLTKGYKIQTESGLDMKKGYKFESMETITEDNYSFKYQALIREGKNEVAGISVIITIRYAIGAPKVYYLCIPVRNPNLLSLYANDLKTIDERAIKPFLKYTSGLMASMWAMEEKQIEKH